MITDDLRDSVPYQENPVPDSDRTLHVGQPNLSDRAAFDRLVDEMYENRWFTNNGQLVQRLELRLSEYLQVKHVVLVNNGTTGLQIAAQALGLTGEVILPAFTFVATAHALQWVGLKPVFCDIDPQTHCIDPQKIEALITEQTSAIAGVHVWGRPCPTDAINEIARRHDLATLYDAAHAFGCRHQGRMLGNFGQCEVFSLHATKFFHTFEGGAVTTNDDALAEKIRLMKNFGFESMDRVVELGVNGKMPEVCAAMGLASLEQLDDVLEVNRRNYRAYDSGLSDIPYVHLHPQTDLEGTNFHYIVVEVDEDAPLSRDEILKQLHDAHILARRYFSPACHRMEPYRTLYPEYLDALPETDRLCQRIMILPTGTAISPDDISRICATIRSSLTRRKVA
ncbi:aminotransferase class I/II-fold pyridoxal phosphate-dependent enzyme [Symmachiella macrocystis]|uniref:aminotransferase class I/II-fold pyridoxal phosphate-dependent enzyme n=1 Tax=Symmachiella macrocystis TaxID=2527985 RepID=UPI0018D2E6FE|nr:aminotransferase class I/II-fold pyridoxal phosphate-dependent enzyme [Symmachiella macrocystis]